MTWQTILSIIIVAGTAGLTASLYQYPANAVPHWIPIALAVLAAVGASLRSIGVTSIGAAPASAKPPMPMAPQPVAPEVPK